MSQNQSLTWKAANLRTAINEVKKRVSILTGFLLEEGISVKAYRQLQILHSELGEMPELPAVETDGKVYMRGDSVTC